MFQKLLKYCINGEKKLYNRPFMKIPKGRTQSPVCSPRLLRQEREEVAQLLAWPSSTFPPFTLCYNRICTNQSRHSFHCHRRCCTFCNSSIRAGTAEIFLKLGGTLEGSWRNFLIPKNPVREAMHQGYHYRTLHGTAGVILCCSCNKHFILYKVSRGKGIISL